MNTIELLPCPFCGAKPNDDHDSVARRISCPTIGCAMNGYGVSVQQWNQRLDDTRLRSPLRQDMKHPTVRQIFDYAEGVGTAQDKQAVLRHLESCGMCAQKYHTIRSVLFVHDNWAKITPKKKK